MKQGTIKVTAEPIVVERTIDGVTITDLIEAMYYCALALGFHPAMVAETMCSVGTEFSLGGEPNE